MRRVVAYLAVAAVAVALVFVLRQRKRAFVAAQVQLLQSDDPEEAAEARKRLQRVGRSAVRPVCALLEHEDEAIRARAALTLANIGHAAAAGPLMEAAKRGDYAAAEALAFLEHPRAPEALSYARARLASAQLDELHLRLPVGGRPPTEACADWREPAMPFQTPSRELVPFPESLDRRWRTTVGLDAPPQYVTQLEDDAVAERLIVAGRLKELWGEYYEAAVYYQQALGLEPESQAAREGAARTERLAPVKREVEARFPAAAVSSVLEHPTWRQDDVTHYVCVLSWADIPSAGPTDRQLLVCRRSDPEADDGEVVPTFQSRIFSTTEREWMRDPVAYVGTISLQQGDPAAAVLIRAFLPQGSSQDLAYDVSLYRLDDGTLKQILRVPSTLMPWVGDLDEDGDAEIVTWQGIPAEPQARRRGFAHWPVVRTLVDGHYEARTQSFPTIIKDFVAAATRRGASLMDDGRGCDYLAYAYETLGETDLAISTYRAAELNYWQRAAELATKGSAAQARSHVARALEARHHRLRLQAQPATPPDG